mmetsp:Transcript_17816/g.28844  ORF Transcript_17816/g.28844 Transcript_17816/m.28844 type:complete len:143 (+) Transcript_17816:212-640(+)
MLAGRGVELKCIPHMHRRKEQTRKECLRLSRLDESIISKGQITPKTLWLTGDTRLVRVKARKRIGLSCDEEILYRLDEFGPKAQTSPKVFKLTGDHRVLPQKAQKVFGFDFSSPQEESMRANQRKDSLFERLKRFFSELRSQ